jgi:hypothetical protein
MGRQWCSRWGQMRLSARKPDCMPYGRGLDKFGIYRAGGTGIEPATCGFGDIASLAVTQRYLEDFQARDARRGPSVADQILRW